jgi:hypothetical protein
MPDLNKPVVFKLFNTKCNMRWLNNWFRWFSGDTNYSDQEGIAGCHRRISKLTLQENLMHSQANGLLAKIVKSGHYRSLTRIFDRNGFYLLMHWGPF